MQPIQMQLSENLKTFSNILLNFWNLHQILNILKTKMILSAYVFSKIKTVKCMVRQKSKEPCFIAPFYCQYIKCSQNPFEILMRGLLSNYFVNLKEAELENLSVSDI